MCVGERGEEHHIAFLWQKTKSGCREYIFNLYLWDAKKKREREKKKRETNNKKFEF